METKYRIWLEILYDILKDILHTDIIIIGTKALNIITNQYCRIPLYKIKKGNFIITQDTIPANTPFATYFPHPAHIKRILSQFNNEQKLQLLQSYAAAIIETISYITQMNIDINIQNDMKKKLYQIYGIQYQENTPQPQFDLISYILCVSKLFAYEKNSECFDDDEVISPININLVVDTERDDGDDIGSEIDNINEIKHIYLYRHFGGILQHSSDHDRNILSIKKLTKNLHKIYIQLIPDATHHSQPTITTADDLNILKITFDTHKSPIELYLYFLKVWDTLKDNNVAVMGSGIIVNNLNIDIITFLRGINEKLFTHNICYKLEYVSLIPPLTPFFLVVPEEDNLVNAFKEKAIISPTNYMTGAIKFAKRTKEDVLKAETRLKAIAKHKSEVEALLKGTAHNSYNKTHVYYMQTHNNNFHIFS